MLGGAALGFRSFVVSRCAKIFSFPVMTLVGVGIACLSQVGFAVDGQSG